MSSMCCRCAYICRRYDVCGTMLAMCDRLIPAPTPTPTHTPTQTRTRRKYFCMFIYSPPSRLSQKRLTTFARRGGPRPFWGALLGAAGWCGALTWSICWRCVIDLCLLLPLHLPIPLHLYLLLFLHLPILLLKPGLAASTSTCSFIPPPSPGHRCKT